MRCASVKALSHLRHCKDCGGSFRGHHNRQYCDQCPNSLQRNYSGSVEFQRKTLCEACGVDISGRPSQAVYCLSCSVSDKRFANALRRKSGEVDYNHLARQITNHAVKIGFLPMPESFQCLDCGAPAECYDHRDYSKPLDVDPVCLRCNSSRGRGKPVSFPCTEHVAQF